VAVMLFLSSGSLANVDPFMCTPQKIARAPRESACTQVKNPWSTALLGKLDCLLNFLSNRCCLTV